MTLAPGLGAWRRWHAAQEAGGLPPVAPATHDLRCDKQSGTNGRAAKPIHLPVQDQRPHRNE